PAGGPPPDCSSAVAVPDVRRPGPRTFGTHPSGDRADRFRRAKPHEATTPAQSGYSSAPGQRARRQRRTEGQWLSRSSCSPARQTTRRQQPGGIRELECHRPARGCSKEDGRTMDQPIILLIVAAIVFILVVALGISLRVNAQKKGLRDKHSIDADVTGELSIDEVTDRKSTRL